MSNLASKDSYIQKLASKICARQDLEPRNSKFGKYVSIYFETYQYVLSRVNTLISLYLYSSPFNMYIGRLCYGRHLTIKYSL